MDQVVAAVVGAFVTVGLGTCVTLLLKCLVKAPEKPPSVTDDQWTAITKRSGAGEWIGFFERLLFFSAFSFDQLQIIAAWLAFKLAAKWEAWKNIVQVPPSIDEIKPLAWYHVRRVLGSWLLSRFLLGTLMNIIVGGIGGVVTLKFPELIVWLRS